MRRSQWKTAGWEVVGLLLSIVGILIFVVVIMDVFFAPPENSLENLSTDQLPYVLTSIVLIAAGKLVSWQLGSDSSAMGALGNQRTGTPDLTVLEELGYELPPEAEEDTREVGNADADIVVCAECGVENETGYRFCSNCSAELSA